MVEDEGPGWYCCIPYIMAFCMDPKVESGWQKWRINKYHNHNP